MCPRHEYRTLRLTSTPSAPCSLRVMSFRQASPLFWGNDGYKASFDSGI